MKPNFGEAGQLRLPRLTIEISSGATELPYHEMVIDADIAGPTGMLTLEPAEFLKSSESSIDGEEMLKRAANLGAQLGLRHAIALLMNQGGIPEEYRKFYWPFPGTIFRDPDGLRLVPCLGWFGGEWLLRFGQLEGVWVAGGRVLRPCT